MNLYLSPSSLPLVPLLPCPATGQMMFSWSYSKGRLPEFTSTMWSVLSILKIGLVLFQWRLCTATGLTWTTSKEAREMTVRKEEVQACTMTLLKAPAYYPSLAGTTPKPLSLHSSHPLTQLRRPVRLVSAKNSFVKFTLTAGEKMCQRTES